MSEEINTIINKKLPPSMTWESPDHALLVQGIMNLYHNDPMKLASVAIKEYDRQNNVNTTAHIIEYKQDDNKDNKGYILCLSHPIMSPNVYYIGHTFTPPEIEVALLNKAHFADFKIEVSKQVNDCIEAKNLIYTILAKFRVRDDRNFFKTSIESIRPLFNLIGV